MIIHFLKRDFLDFRVYWFIVAGITLAYGMAHHFTKLDSPGSPWSSLQVLLFAYFFLAIMPQSYVLGSVWRTQHQLSRHYLLALPISHRHLFTIQHYRMVVFWIPVLGLCSIYPFLGKGFSSASWDTWMVYYIALLTTCVLFIEYGIWSTVQWEEMTSYLPQSARMRAWLKMLVPIAVFLLVVEPAWMRLLTPIWFPRLKQMPDTFSFLGVLMGATGPPPSLVFPALALFLIVYWIPHNARKWCVTL